VSQELLPKSFPVRPIKLVLLLLAGGAMIGLSIPLVWRTTNCSYRGHCTNNLKQLYSLVLGYAQKQGINACPIGDGREPSAHESLNKLVDFEGEGLNPKLFICPEGEESAAQVDSSGKFKLSAETLSYSWVKERIELTTAIKVLSSDKYIQGFDDGTDTHQGHTGGMQVLLTDGSVSFVPEAVLPPATKLPESLTR